MNGKSKDQMKNIDDLYNWLDTIHFSRPAKNLARDFSDGLLMAELLKHHFPKLVDLHNYIPANSSANKLKNWIWLNDKVLKLIGIGQEIKVLKEISSTNHMKLEKLLLNVKNKVDEFAKLKSKNITAEGEIMEAEMKTNVSLAEYNELCEKLRDRAEDVSILHAKVKHLEAMVQLKDQRIEDLVAQIKKCICSKQ